MLSNNVAKNGSGGAVYIDMQSRMNFTGYIKFENNTAVLGGTISSYTESYVSFLTDATVHFLKNYAKNSGGVIYCLNSKIIYHGWDYNDTNTIRESMSDKYLFDSNNASFGGAITMSGTSMLILNPNVKISLLKIKHNLLVAQSLLKFSLVPSVQQSLLISDLNVLSC